MLQQVARLFGMSARKNRTSRLTAAARRQRFFAESHRNARIEQLESRQVMDATLHNIIAANVNIVQNNTGNTEASITMSTPYSFNGFGFRPTYSRGDYTVQMGSSALDDIAGGILLASINNNGRDNGETNSGSTAAGMNYGIPSVHDDANGYWIAVHNVTAPGVPTTPTSSAGIEYNFNVSAAYFPYADGWIGGLARNAARTNGSATALNDFLTGSPGLTLGTHYINTVAGQSTIDLRTMGINSQTDGVLIVNHGKNENNHALSQANADGTWTVFTKGHNADGTGVEQDPVAFVYIPKSDTRVISGKFRGGDNNIAIQSTPFTVTNPSTGTYHLEIPGQSPSTGVLIISAEGGGATNNDNPVSFVANGTGWDIQTRDLTSTTSTLENIPITEAVVSFVFVPGPTPAINITPTTGLLTSEAGTTATFEVKLDTMPTADVTIPLSSSNPAEGTISTSSLTFTSANWNVPQIVTITGQDDVASDGAIAFSIVTAPAVSADANYSGRDAVNVAVTNADNEAGITVNPISGLTTTEGGGTATFTVQLNTAPTADVVIPISSSNPAEGTASVVSLTFTSADWNVPQTVTITGSDDPLDDGDVAYSIVTGATTSTDSLYNGLNAADVSITNTDNDTAEVIVNVGSPIGLTVNENGASQTFTIVLGSRPAANVTVGLTSNNLTEGTVSPGSVTFAPADWNVPQTVTVTGVNDALRDGDIAFSIVTTATTSSDPAYQGLSVDDVAVTNRNNDPTLTASSGVSVYGIGGVAVGVDPLATIADPVSTNYNNYQLIATLTAGANVDDRLEIRNTGTAAGQIGVAGTDITFGGTLIGTFAGGMGSTPLTITFNSNASPSSAQAVLRAITFRSVSANPPQTARSVSLVLNGFAGDPSNTISRGITVGLVRVTELQQGIDRGTGFYSGQVDIQLTENQPNASHPIGSTAGELLVDFPNAANAAQILLKYNNLFGSGPGQIPLGATIVSAELLVNVKNAGEAGTLHRLLTPWNENTETWNTFGNGALPRNGAGGVQTDDAEARAVSDSPWGLIGSGDTGTGVVSIGVTNDLIAWGNGEVNEGWVITGWNAQTDGTSISPSEDANPLLRPRLKVKWLPAGVNATTFREGLDGYTGAVDTNLQSDMADVPMGTNLTLGVDGASPVDLLQALLKFDNIIGTGVGQIPPGSTIHSAALILSSTTSNGMGDGGRFFPMLQSWDMSATWDSLVGGIQADGTEAATTLTTQAGVATLAPDVQGGYNPFDVTADVQSWVNGSLANNGWAILPWANGTNGWFFGSSDILVETSRPTLKVFFTAPVIVTAPPVNSTPVGPISGSEDTNLPLNGANAITVSDADAGTNNLTTTISVPDTTVGTFTATNGGGTANVTSTNGGATITIVGPQAEINTALTTLIFVPALNRNTTSGTTTITVATFDGVATDTDTFDVTLTPINDAPTFTAANPPAVSEDATAVSLPGFITAFNPGPNESSQTVVSYNVSNVSNSALFSAAPAIATNGTLSYTLAANAFGSSTFDVTVTDNGGTANGGVATSSVQTFTITANPVNDAPSFVKGADLNIGFNVGAQTVAGWATVISAGPTNENTQTVSFNVSNNNATLFAVAPTIASNGTLQFTPATGASGTATITVFAQDSGGTTNGGVNQSPSQTFVINVAAAVVNAMPTINAISNVTINEDALLQTVNFSGVSAGGDTPAQAVAITVSSSNPTLIPTPTVSYTSPAATGSLSFTPAATLSGTSTITVTVRDSGLDLIPGNTDDGITPITFTVTVNSVNDVPSFTIGANQTVNEDAAAQTVNGFISVSSPGPSNEVGQTLTYNITANSNPGLFAVAPSISSTGVLTYTPTANAFGVATITVTVSDNGGTANGGVDTSGTQTFTITLNPVNDVPSFVKGSDLLIPFNSLAQTIPGWATAISAGPANESTQALTFVVTNNSNPSLFAVAPAVASDGTLTFTHTPGQQGSATITLRVTDNGGTTNGGVDQSSTQTFVITVDAPVNGLPTINAIPTLPLLEDAGLQTVNLSGITAGGEVQNLQVTVSSSNTGLIATPTVTYTSPNTTGSLTFTPTANASGSSTITVTVRDAGFNLTLGDSDDGITVRTFVVNVTPVNDPVDAVDGGFNTLIDTPVSGTLTATDIDGPALTYSILMPPALGTLTAFNAATGAFTYTPLPGAVGLELFSFSVTDGTSSDTAQVRISIQPLVPTVVPVGGDLNILGTAAPDTIIVSAATSGNALVRLQSGSFNSTGIYPLTGLIRVESGAGRDYIVVSGLTGPTHLDAGADDDYVSGALGDDTIIGGSGHDQINASGGNNIVWGDIPGEQDLATGGNDVLSSLTGNDVLYGGGGDDQLFSGAGNDYLHAGQGNDLSSAGLGDDRLFGGSGNDVLAGDAGNDIISGNSGNDQLLGSEGNDLLIGGSGGLADDINGGGGDDLLVGSGTTNDSSFVAGDANDTALLALLANWNSTHAAGLLAGTIAADDGVRDIISGSTGDDDFYASLTDLCSDMNATAMGTDRQFP